MRADDAKNLKDIQFYDNFTFAGGYTGPAFKVGAGVQGSEILTAAAAKGHIVATGVCDVGLTSPTAREALT